MSRGTMVKFSMKVINDKIQEISFNYIWPQMFLMRQRHYVLLNAKPNAQTVNSVILYHSCS